MGYNLLKRGSHFYFLRRVPLQFRKYDSRERIRIALKTNDPVIAHRRAQVLNTAIEKYWQSLIAQKKSHATSNWEDAIGYVKAYGYSYKSIDELVNKESTEEILNRLSVLENSQAHKNKVEALVGLNICNDVKLCEVEDLFFELSKEQVIGKSQDAVRKWKNPRKRALKNFQVVTAIDKTIGSIVRKDILNFKEFWRDKITDEYLDPDTGNKDFMHLKEILTLVAVSREIPFNPSLLFADIKFKGHKESRLPFEPAFVVNKILAPHALDTMNVECQCIVHIMAETGAGISEIVGLDPQNGDFRLEEEIPFIDIRPNKIRSLKTKARPRKIPLVGCALNAARLICQKGFVQYTNADSASAAINKYFSEHAMKPTEKHSLYSLRHTFKDRLRDAGAPEGLIDELMGHANNRPKYGRGYTLETKHTWLSKIQFK